MLQAEAKQPMLGSPLLHMDDIPLIHGPGMDTDPFLCDVLPPLAGDAITQPEQNMLPQPASTSPSGNMHHPASTRWQQQRMLSKSNTWGEGTERDIMQDRSLLRAMTSPTEGEEALPALHAEQETLLTLQGSHVNPAEGTQLPPFRLATSLAHVSAGDMMAEFPDAGVSGLNSRHDLGVQCCAPALQVVQESHAISNRLVPHSIHPGVDPNPDAAMQPSHHLLHMASGQSLSTTGPSNMLRRCHGSDGSLHTPQHPTAQAFVSVLLGDTEAVPRHVNASPLGGNAMDISTLARFPSPFSEPELPPATMEMLPDYHVLQLSSPRRRSIALQQHSVPADAAKLCAGPQAQQSPPAAGNTVQLPGVRSFRAMSGGSDLHNLDSATNDPSTLQHASAGHGEFHKQRKLDQERAGTPGSLAPGLLQLGECTDASLDDCAMQEQGTAGTQDQRMDGPSKRVLASLRPRKNKGNLSTIASLISDINTGKPGKGNLSEMLQDVPRKQAVKMKDRVLEQNRSAQARYRERQKEKYQLLQNEVDELKQQLQHMEVLNETVAEKEKVIQDLQKKLKQASMFEGLQPPISPELRGHMKALDQAVLKVRQALDDGGLWVAPGPADRAEVAATMASSPTLLVLPARQSSLGARACSTGHDGCTTSASTESAPRSEPRSPAASVGSQLPPTATMQVQDAVKLAITYRQQKLNQVSNLALTELAVEEPAQARELCDEWQAILHQLQLTYAQEQVIQGITRKYWGLLQAVRQQRSMLVAQASKVLTGIICEGGQGPHSSTRSLATSAGMQGVVQQQQQGLQMFNIDGALVGCDVGQNSHMLPILSAIKAARAEECRLSLEPTIVLLRHILTAAQCARFLVMSFPDKCDAIQLGMLLLSCNRYRAGCHSL